MSLRWQHAPPDGKKVQATSFPPRSFQSDLWFETPLLFIHADSRSLNFRKYRTFLVVCQEKILNYFCEYTWIDFFKPPAVLKTTLLTLPQA